jgi:hypothetical protein
MLTIYQGEQRNGRIKFTTDRDCLAPDLIRFEIRYFPCLTDLQSTAMQLEARGFRVCIDTEELFYETAA